MHSSEELPPSLEDDDVSTATVLPAAAHATTKKKRVIVRRAMIRPAAATSHSTASSATTTSFLLLPPHIQNNTQLHHIISTTLPRDYEFEIPKTIWRIEKMNATSVALQLPEGLTMYASTIGDILIKFAYRFQPPPPSSSSTTEEDETDNKPTRIKSLSILGDVTYGACCIDDLSARALGCDLLVHYGHSCLVPLTCTVLPCLYIFVEIRVDVQHLVDCVKLTFRNEEEERRRRKRVLLPTHDHGEDDHRGSPSSSSSSRIIEILVMGTVQFRSAVIESAQRLNNEESSCSSSSSACDIQFRAMVPQAKPLSPGEVLGCTAPSGLATLDFEEALSSSSTKNKNSRRQRQQQAKRNTTEYSTTETTAVNDATPVQSSSLSEKNNSNNNNGNIPTRERVMIFVADGRFHLEAAMIANPTLRALRYDPYSKTLAEESYDGIRTNELRREAILSVRRIWGLSASRPTTTAHDVGVVSAHAMDVASIGKVGMDNIDSIANSVLPHQASLHTSPFSKMSLSSSSSSSDSIRTTKIFGIILGTLGRQGNPAILSRIRSLLRARGIRSITILLSEIFPKKLEMMSNTNKTIGGGGGGGGGVCAWVQIACPRLSIDWGHYFCVPVLSPYELFVAMGEVVDSSLWKAVMDEEGREEEAIDDTHGQNCRDSGYPMDFYSKSGGPWANYYESNSDRKVMSYGN